MNFFENGKLYAGCNYWASHCGIKMWSDWSEETVDKDFEQLATLGIKLVRVFPLWSDFQPIKKIYEFEQRFAGYSIDGGDTLLDSFSSGIDETMMLRFEKMLDLAKKHGLSVIPSLITGWMSGRLFVPDALEGKNIICDPESIKWQVRFIKAFVRRFKYHTAIAAWCLGNECNCMSPVDNSEQAWLWTNTLADAFRSQDPDRKVISGMHSQFTPNEKKWTLQDSGDCCDIITTHPYASPTYKTDQELINTIKPLIHPAAQTIYSSSIAGKPCFIEEIGTYGQMYADKEHTAKYCEGTLYGAWAHNCLAYLWWIGFDQGSLTYHPFGYNNRASNYGLFKEDRSLKPVGKVIKEFNQFTENLDFEKLPERIIDAVCIVTPGQNTWQAAGSTFILAKQARLDITYAYSLNKLPDANAYFIPSISSASAFSSDYIAKLMKKVENGATLYVSVAGGFPRNLADDFGFNIITRKTVTAPDTVTIDDSSFKLLGNVIYNTRLTTAQSLAKNQNGQDVFMRSKYGKGTVFTLFYPMETYLYGVLDAFANNPYYKIYDKIAQSINPDKAVSCENRMLGITEHPLNDNERIIVVTNYGNDTTDVITLKDGWKFDKAYLGQVYTESDTLKINIDNTKTAVYKIKK